MAVDAASVSGRIAQAIEAVIRGLKLDATILRRKRMVVLDGDGPKVVLIEVADDEQYEAICNGNQEGYLLWACKRPCGVALGYASQGKTGNNEQLRIDRGKIEDAINAKNLQRAGLVGNVASANDVLPYGRMVFDPASTPGVDWSVMTFTVECLEEKKYGG